MARAGTASSLIALGLFCLSAPAMPAQATTVAINTVYRFGSSSTDGTTPLGGVVADSQHRFYGTTSRGGAYGYGTVYRIFLPTQKYQGGTEEILHSFTGKNGDGATPMASVILGSDGSVYGTTSLGGTSGRGMVFKLANTPGWPLTVLHAFGSSGPGYPEAALAFGTDGLLYGTTSYFDDERGADEGTEFSVSAAGDTVEFKLLRTFGQTGPSGDGIAPLGLASLPPPYANFSNGFLGATTGGPNGEETGNVFSLRIGPKGNSDQTTLYTFGPLPDVNTPTAAPIVGQGAIAGALYGCAQGGGFGFIGSYYSAVGGIYQLEPNGTGGFAESVLYPFGQSGYETESIPGPGCSIVQGTESGILYGVSSSDDYVFDSNLFELDPPSSPGGSWTYQVIAQFNPAYNGLGPQPSILRLENRYYVIFSTGDYFPGTLTEITIRQ
jgi:uncharacterized repeat protein (TIGR03803 family)